MTLFEQSPEKYIKQYIYNQKPPATLNMRYGSLMADGLENNKFTGDPILDLIITRLPKFELMDVAFEVNLKDGHKTIKILAKPDTAKADYTAFKEYKTSLKKWTQKMADDSGQITFYATAVWLLKGFIPENIELVNVRTTYQSDGSLTPTGEMFRYLTTRNMVDIIKMTSRMRKSWIGIKILCERELL